MRKINVLIALLAAILLMGVLPVMAADPPSFEVETVTARAGETVDVEIAVKNSPGITSAKLRVVFGDALTLERVTYGTAVAGSFVWPQKTTSPVILNWANGLQDFSGNFLFATLTFTVAQDAAVGMCPVAVTYDPDDVYDIKESNKTFAAVSGGVKVSKAADGSGGGDTFRAAVVSDGKGGQSAYSDLNAAVMAVAAMKGGGTVTLLADQHVSGVVIPSGVTLDLGDSTLTAGYVIGVNGSCLTATPNSGRLKVARGRLALPEQGCRTASGQYILPVWDPGQNCYLFSRFEVDTGNSVHGLFVDEDAEVIRFRFRHQATDVINRTLLADGAGDNALKVVVRLAWAGSGGQVHQDFVFSDGLVGKAAGSYDYTFTLADCSALGIDPDTLRVTGMIITDSGAAATGAEWTAERTK